MKQWRIAAMAVVTVLFLLLIVHLGYSVSKDPEPSSVAKQPKPRSTTSPFTKNISRKIHSTWKQTRENVLSRWKVNDTSSVRHSHFCWENESVEIIGECIHCSRYEKRVSPVCLITGNKQLVLCKKSKKKVYKSCAHVKWLEKRNFWTFEATAVILLICSSLSAYQRNKKLDAIFNEKLRKRVANEPV
ncbi:protein JTB [Nematostella vectensis]|uniref:protein JTB n=1 Tax=Nematostella vectensis TaxID=45351 RepID=UPI0020772ED2|nr:protein JTB [Nematostella vectensis]